jgi:hypothetical protein
MPFSSLSRCVSAASSSLVRSLTYHRHFSPAPLALERRAGLVSAKDVPHRRPRRHRDRGPDIRCARPQVRPAKIRRAVFLTISCSNFMRQQAMGSKMVFNRPVPVNRLVSAIADSASCVSRSDEADARAVIRGPGEYAGIRSASVWRRLPCRRARPHRPTPVRVLTERHILRVLRRLDRRAQPERQDLPRETLRVLCRLYVISFLSTLAILMCTRACVCRQFGRPDPPRVACPSRDAAAGQGAHDQQYRDRDRRPRWRARGRRYRR